MPQDDGLSQLTALMREERTYDAGNRAPREPVDPDIRRKSTRTRLITGGIVAVLVVGLTASYVTWASNAAVGTAAAVSEAPTVASGTKAEIRMSPEGASALTIAGGEDYLGPTASGIFATSGGDKARPIASISKLVTAMVILDKYPLKNADDPGPSITFGKGAHDLYDAYYIQGATVAEMPTGVTHTLHDSLEAMLVASACNYADAVSMWAFGSRSAFLSATKSWLTKNGMPHTTILEPTGLDARNTSTPSDLITLGKLAMANPAIAQIVGMRSLDVPGIPSVGNTNTLLGAGVGVNGLKTGTLEQSGSDLLFSATLSPTGGSTLTITGVVLGGFSRQSVNADVTDMLNSITEGFQSIPVARAGQAVGTYTTPWGESASMVLKSNTDLVVWSDTPITAKIVTTTLTTGEKGEEVGHVTFTAGPNSTTVPVILDEAISPPDQWWRLTHPFELGQSAK